MNKLGKGKKIGLGVGIAFAILIIIGAVGGSTSSSNSHPITVPVGDKEHPAQMGQIVPVGDIAYKVNSVSTRETIGNDLFNEKANGVYLVINLSIENNGKESVHILSNYFNLIDSQGRQFSGDDKAWIYLEDNVVFKQLQPGLPSQGQLVFDVPKSSELYTLKISGGLNSLDEGYISLGQYPRQNPVG